MTQLQLIEQIKQDENIEIGKSTMGDILRYPEKWKSSRTQSPSSSASRQRPPKHAALEEAVYMWMCDMTSRNATLNDEMVIMKAKKLGQELGIQDFEYSSGWLTRFKKRKGIQRRLLEGEARSADPSVVDNGRLDLQESLAEYGWDDIFNMDETGLFFRLGPNQTLASHKVIYL